MYSLRSSGSMFATRITIAVALIAWSLDLIRQSLQGGANQSMAGAAAGYPIWVLTGTAVLIGFVLIVDLLPMARRGSDRFSDVLPTESNDRWRLGVFLTMWIGYVVALPVLGFLLATAIAAFSSVTLLDRQSRWWLVLPGSVLFALSVEVVFRGVFYVLLPGSALDEWVDSLLYKL
jgi:hypothetical protein